MHNLSFHNTEGRTDYTRGGIRERISDRPAVESAISKSAILVDIFQSVLRFTPHQNTFPHFVKDWRIASRAKEILGLPQDKPWGKGPYSVFGLEVYKWLDGFEKIIGRPLIDAAYIVGSAAVYIAGQPLLREALDIFFKHIPDTHPDKYNLFVKLLGKIAKKSFSFADVDLRIKVKTEVNLQLLQKQINEIKGCRTDLFYGKLLLVLIEDENGNALDVAIYNELETESAFNLDDFKINIYKSELENNIVSFDCVDSWNCWFGQTLGVLEDKTGDRIADKFRVFPRVLSQLTRSNISILPTESTIFPLWIQSINLKDKTALKTQFDKHKANHDRQVPFASCLMRLRTQQLILEHSPTSQWALREAGNDEVPESAPWFFKALFHVMQDKEVDIASIHSLIECFALLALYEAWHKPFEVKLVKHEGKWVLRIRFRGTFGKRDLLVRFNVSESMNALKAIPKKQWKKIRIIIHSVMTGDMEQREIGKSYRKTFPIPIQQNDILTLRKKLLEKTGIKSDNLTIASQPSLAQLEISWNQKVQYLLKVGKIVFNHYHFDLTKRRKLCWDVVFKCIEYRGYSQAAEMVNLLRGVHEDPSDGYPSLFAHAINKNADSYLLYQACSPFPAISEEQCMELSQSKEKISIVQKLMNEMDISAELFLELVELLKIKKPVIGEKLLCKLIAHDRKNACKLIMERDDNSFNSQEYTALISRYMMENLNSFNPFWIKNFIFSKRFVGSQEEILALCQHILNKPIVVQDKAAILQQFEIKESSLWQIIANEYIKLGEKWPESFNKDSNIDYESLVLWHQIIERADDTAFVEETLLKIKTKDSIRALVLVQLLKNWGKRKVAIEILKKLDISKKSIPWETVLLQAETGADILRNLNNISLPLYSGLLRALKPKEPFYVSWWVKMMEEACPGEKLITELQKPLMIDCLQIHPLTSLPLYKRVAHTKDGVLLALNTLKEVDEELFYALLKTCVDLDDQGETGGRVVLEYYDIKKHPKTIELTQYLRVLAKKILMNPQGDIDAVLKIARAIKKDANPDQLPCKEQLYQLIRNNAKDWVIELLNNATNQELEKLPSDFYCFLINACKELEKRCIVIEKCPMVSEAIQKKWETLAQTDGIDIFSAGKLLESAPKLRIPALKVQHCVLFVLSNLSNHSLQISERTLKYLLDMIPNMDIENGFKLWSALNKLKKIEKKELFRVALELLNLNPLSPHYNLLQWVFNNVTEQTNNEVMELVTKMPLNCIEERIRKVIIKWLKKQAIKNDEMAKKLYWELDGDDDVSYKELEALNPTHEQLRSLLNRLIERSKKEKLSDTMLNSIHHLCLTHEEFLNSTLQFLENDSLKEVISPWIVFQAHLLPQHIERLQIAVDSLKEMPVKKHLKITLASAQLIATPTQEHAISFVRHLDTLWDQINNGLLTNDVDSWRKTLKGATVTEEIHESLSAPNPLYELLFIFINNNFIKSKEKIYFEPEVLKLFLRMISNRSKKLPFLHMTLCKMLLRSVRKNFHESVATQVFKFIVVSAKSLATSFNQSDDNVPIYFKAKDLSFYFEILTQMSEIIVENYPTMCRWAQPCCDLLRTYIPKKCATKAMQQIFDEGCTVYFALRGSIGYAAHVVMRNDNERSQISVTNAIHLLCSTPYAANHTRAEKILVAAIKDVKNFGIDHVKSSNRAYVKGILNILTDEDLYIHLPQLFRYILENKTELLDVLALELIYENICEILLSRPHFLLKIIDFVNANILCELSKFYRKHLDYYQVLLNFLYLECARSHSKGLTYSAAAYEKFGILVQTHPYVTIEFLHGLVKNKEVLQQITFAMVHCHSFKLSIQNPDDLLKFNTALIPQDPKAVPIRDIYKLELCLKHLWCAISTEFFIGIGFDLNSHGTAWLERIKDEFISSFFIAAHIPCRGALTINILSTFDKVLILIKAIAINNSQYANNWLASLMTGIDEKMSKKGKPWFMIRILEIMGKNMSMNLYPNLQRFEEFYEKFNPVKIKSSPIEAYLACMEGRVVQGDIVLKAVKNCGDILKKIHFKSEDVGIITGCDTIYVDFALENMDQFEKVYFAGFMHSIEKYKTLVLKEEASEIPKGESVVIFVEDIARFRSYTDKHAAKCQHSSDNLLIRLITHINDELYHLKDQKMFHEIMLLVLYLQDIYISNPEMQPEELAEIKANILLFSIFSADASVDSLGQFITKYLKEVSAIDVTHIHCDVHLKNLLKWIILLDEKKQSTFSLSVTTRALADKEFMNLFDSSMDEILVELKRYKQIRPELSDWYEKWILTVGSKLISLSSCTQVLDQYNLNKRHFQSKDK